MSYQCGFGENYILYILGDFNFPEIDWIVPSQNVGVFAMSGPRVVPNPSTSAMPPKPELDFNSSLMYLPICLMNSCSIQELLVLMSFTLDSLLDRSIQFYAI